MRWLEMSEPCSVNLQYNGLHTCLASVCVTVHAGVWVQGHIAWVPVFMSSILPAGEGTISTLKKTSYHLWLHTGICHSSGSSLRVWFIQVSASLLHLPFVHCKEKKIFLQMKADAFTLTPLLQVFTFSAVWPQHFHSIVTPNKHPDCQSGRPAQPSLLPEVSFVENERLRLLWHTSFISPPSNIPKQKRSQTTYMAGCHFSFMENSQILKTFPKVALPVESSTYRVCHLSKRELLTFFNL